MTSNTGQTVKPLLALLFDTLSVAALSVGTAEAVYFVLSARAEIEAIRLGLDAGSITENQVQQFVRKLQLNFKIGERFYGDVALSSLAVALEKRPTAFAKTFLEKLAALKVQELPLASRIASLALAARARHLGGQTSRTVELSSPIGGGASLILIDQPHRVASSNTDSPSREYCYEA